MTRKDYTQIAAALRAVQPVKTWSADKHAQFEMTVHTLADYLHEDNPRFDYTRFYEACGLVQEGPGEYYRSIHEHSSACDCKQKAA